MLMLTTQSFNDVAIAYLMMKILLQASLTKSLVWTILDLTRLRVLTYAIM